MDKLKYVSLRGPGLYTPAEIQPNPCMAVYRSCSPEIRRIWSVIFLFYFLFRFWLIFKLYLSLYQNMQYRSSFSFFENSNSKFNFLSNYSPKNKQPAPNQYNPQTTQTHLIPPSFSFVRSPKHKPPKYEDFDFRPALNPNKAFILPAAPNTIISKNSNKKKKTQMPVRHS